MAADDPILRALDLLPYGLFVVTSGDENDRATIIANWVSQVSFSPALLAIALEHDSAMRNYVARNGFFSVNVLPAGTKDLAKKFLRSTTDNRGTLINGMEFISAPHGSGFLRDALASCECRVLKSVEAGDHMVFFGEVVHATVNTRGGALTLQETGWHYRGK